MVGIADELTWDGGLRYRVEGTDRVSLICRCESDAYMNSYKPSGVGILSLVTRHQLALITNYRFHACRNWNR
jgi:hypothetical protein